MHVNNRLYDNGRPGWGGGAGVVFDNRKEDNECTYVMRMHTYMYAFSFDSVPRFNRYVK